MESAGSRMTFARGQFERDLYSLTGFRIVERTTAAATEQVAASVAAAASVLAATAEGLLAFVRVVVVALPGLMETVFVEKIAGRRLAGTLVAEELGPEMDIVVLNAGKAGVVLRAGESICPFEDLARSLLLFRRESTRSAARVNHRTDRTGTARARRKPGLVAVRAVCWLAAVKRSQGAPTILSRKVLETLLRCRSATAGDLRETGRTCRCAGGRTRIRGRERAERGTRAVNGSIR